MVVHVFSLLVLWRSVFEIDGFSTLTAAPHPTPAAATGRRKYSVHVMSCCSVRLLVYRLRWSESRAPGRDGWALLPRMRQIRYMRSYTIYLYSSAKHATLAVSVCFRCRHGCLDIKWQHRVCPQATFPQHRFSSSRSIPIDCIFHHFLAEIHFRTQSWEGQCCSDC